jgi:hypothetical protein
MFKPMAIWNKVVTPNYVSPSLPALVPSLQASLEAAGSSFFPSGN